MMRAMRPSASKRSSQPSFGAPREVSRKQVEVGQLVAAGQPLLSIVADTGVWVTANFKETQLAKIHPGQPVEFEVDAYGGCVAEGKVASVSGATGAKFAAKSFNTTGLNLIAGGGGAIGFQISGGTSDGAFSGANSKTTAYVTGAPFSGVS